MKREKVFQVTAILSIIGIFLASYLMYQYLKPTYGGVCDISNKVNCFLTTKGDLKDFFGIPVPIIGGVGYITILLSSIFKKKNLVLFMATFGMLFCLRITYLELFVYGVICPVCVLCQLDMALVWGLSLSFLGKKKENPEEEKAES